MGNTDYNWFSKQAVSYAVEGIMAEAKTWEELSVSMSAVRQQAAAQGLSASAFAVFDPASAVTAPQLQSAYAAMQDQLVTLFGQAATEFRKFSVALKMNAKDYQHADANAAQDFDAIAAGK